LPEYVTRKRSARNESYKSNLAHQLRCIAAGRLKVSIKIDLWETGYVGVELN
jgi:hypothetical protein